MCVYMHKCVLFQEFLKCSFKIFYFIEKLNLLDYSCVLYDTKYHCLRYNRQYIKKQSWITSEFFSKAFSKIFRAGKDFLKKKIHTHKINK